MNGGRPRPDRRRESGGGGRPPSTRRPRPAAKRARFSSWRSYWPGAVEEEPDEAVVPADVEDFDDAPVSSTTAVDPNGPSDRLTTGDRARHMLAGVAKPWRAVGSSLQASWPGQPIEHDLVESDQTDHGLVESDLVGEDRSEPSSSSEPLLGPPEPAPKVAAVAESRPHARLRAVASVQPGGAEAVERAPSEAPRRNPLRLPLAGVRQARRIAHAVYSALADPITNADDAARLRRAARVRWAGKVAVSTALVLVLIYAIFPVREYMDQRTASDRQNERLDVLTEANEQEMEYIEWLRSDEGVEWLAREHGFSYPDEDSFTLLPNPHE